MLQSIFCTGSRDVFIGLSCPMSYVRYSNTGVRDLWYIRIPMYWILVCVCINVSTIQYRFHSHGLINSLIMHALSQVYSEFSVSCVMCTLRGPEWYKVTSTVLVEIAQILYNYPRLHSLRSPPAKTLWIDESEQHLKQHTHTHTHTVSNSPVCAHAKDHSKTSLRQCSAARDMCTQTPMLLEFSATTAQLTTTRWSSYVDANMCALKCICIVLRTNTNTS